MRVLIIGSLGGQIGAASQIAIRRGAHVSQVDDIEAGLGALRSGDGASLIMIDVEQKISDLIDGMTAERMSVPVVACGVGSDSQAAVRAIKAGAKEYIPLPPDAELIAAVLTAVAEDDDKIIFADQKMTEVMRLADQVAPSDASILITGPSGTGKEMIARHIHAKSKRKDRRFVAVNCAAIPENLLESELFGHERGAFTGAVARRIGKFEEADGGTLLLDEISEMDVRLQAKLLRALQEREIDRIGSNKPVKVDVRILATSNRDMQEAVNQGSFREDLYFRINVMNLALPPLSERPGDIPELAKFFAKKYAEANAVNDRPIADDAMAMLTSYAWPGNVRELENTMHRAVLLASGKTIDASSVLLQGAGAAKSGAVGDSDAIDGEGGDSDPALVGRTVADVERQLIIETLSHCLGNRTHAANILGISIRTLRNKLKLYSEQGVNVPQPGEERSPI
ncbi:MAG: sigma-54 dependent transcriptional regulator [Rhodospirillales bacterium]